MVYLPRCGERVVALIVLCGSPLACETMVDGRGPSSSPFQLQDLAKTDTDSTLELFVAEQRHLLATLTKKLYLRNPRELKKVAGMTVEHRIQQIFQDDYTPLELARLSGVEQLKKALAPDFAGDRVLAFACGMRAMIDDSYDGQQHFYIPDRLDPQKLYNCARNLELAAWKITHDHGADNQVLLLTNAMPDDAPMNLSYERMFGEMIALQDMSARIVADRSNRTIRFVVQTLVFLPV